MNDGRTVRLVIIVLALLALAVVIGGIALAFSDRGLPGELIAIGSAAAGAIAGILSHTSSDQPTPVNVVNEADDAVPVAQTLVEPDPIPSRPVKRVRKARR